ncbi:hypothetical protein L209DRAFT_297666 [Thermothelomyces heterothallicus CBS 203.75]
MCTTSGHLRCGLTIARSRLIPVVNMSAQVITESGYTKFTLTYPAVTGNARPAEDRKSGDMVNKHTFSRTGRDIALTKPPPPSRRFLVPSLASSSRISCALFSSSPGPTRASLSCGSGFLMTRSSSWPGPYPPPFASYTASLPLSPDPISTI